MARNQRVPSIPICSPTAKAEGTIEQPGCDCDGACEVCLDGQTGFLIQPGDLKNLTAKIILLADDSALREKLGKSGSDFVRENFSVEQMVDSIYNLYLKLAAERGIRL